MTTPNPELGLITRASIPALVAAWNESIAEVRQGMAMLASAEDRLKATFGGGDYGYRFRVAGDYSHHFDIRKADEVVKSLTIEAWQVLVQRLELRRVMSTKRAAQMDRQLAAGEMPAITEENLSGMLLGMLDQVADFMKEAVAETIQFLMPNRQHYVSTSPFVIGKKVVLEWVIENGYHGGFRVTYGRGADQLRGLDNTFHMLDGKGSIKTNRGPLCDAIDASKDGNVETVYFKGKCYINRNLHLTFKRMDLVDKLNQIASDNKLADPTKKRTA